MRVATMSRFDEKSLFDVMSRKLRKEEFVQQRVNTHITFYQGCGVGRFFRIPTPAFLKTRLRLQQFLKNDSDSS